MKFDYDYDYVVWWKSNESQHMLNASTSTTLASEISSLEDPTFKVGKLSAEERKRKIHRYLKKKNERNFSKKIKVLFSSSHCIKNEEKIYYII